MTITNQSSSVTYTGNGVTTNFPFSFPVYDEDHIVVTLITVATEDEAVVNSSFYTVNGVGDADGGSVDYDAITSDYQIRIDRIVPYTQELDIQNQSAFLPEVIEEQFDLLVMMIIQQQTQIDNSIDFSDDIENFQDQIDIIEDTADQALLVAQAAADVGGVVNFYDTKAQADAALAGLANLAVVEVFADESKNGLRTRYRKEAGVYVFKLYLSAWLSDFGAVGDGVTNDAAAIQSAIDSGIKRIAGRPGAIYGIGAAGILFDTLSGVTLDLRSCAVKLLAVPTTQAIKTMGKTSIKFVDCDNCGVLGLGGEINGNNIASNAIGFENCTNCFCDGIEVYDCGVTGQIISAGSDNLRISHNHSHDSIGTARGLWLGNTAADEIDAAVLIEGNKVHDNAATGIVFVSVGGRIKNNLSYDNAGSGIILPGSGGFRAEAVTLVGNICHGNIFHGIQDDIVYSTDADITRYNTLIGNCCYENDGAGIYLAASWFTSLIGNVCYDNNADGVGTAAGITLEDRLKSISLVGNVCFDTRSGGSRLQSHGISLTATLASPASISMNGNNLYNNLFDGMAIAANAGQTITSLLVAANAANINGRWGIQISEADAGSVTGNCVGNSTLGNTTIDLRMSARHIAISNNEYVTDTSADYATFTDLDATPSVKGRRNWRAANSAATSITALDDGQDGHEVRIRNANSNTTYVHSTGLQLKGGIDATPAANQSIAFEKQDGNYREIWRSF